MRLRFLLFCLVSTLMCLAVGCSGGVMGTSSKTITASLSASPTSVTSGSQTTLTWTTANATSISIDQGIGAVSASGTKTVAPTQTTTYTLIATGGSQTVTGTALVTVTAPPAPTIQFSASPTTIQTGQSATLTWSTTNATSISIDQGIGTVAVSGSLSVTPAATTTYTLTAGNGSSSVTGTATVTVSPLAPAIQFSASPTIIQTGQSATLTWSTTNATSVSIDQGIGSVAASGTESVSPTQTTTYTLTATGGQTATGTATLTVTPLTGVLQWKNDDTGDGLYSQETTLTLANVNPTQFGKVRTLITDGSVLAQPLYVRNVNLGANGVHDLILVANEHDSVYAFDGQGPSNTPLWRRNFVEDANGGNTNCTGATCVTTQPDDVGGRSTFGGEIGITGTPVIDPQTGILYLVAATQAGTNGPITDTLHAIDIRTGKDANVGGVVIGASVPGTGEDSVNGQIAFNAAYENQRPGLVLLNGVLYIAFGSFSDTPPYHGWLLAYDATTLKAIFNSTPTYTAHSANYEEGIGAGFWNSGAPPTFEDDGTLYIVAANGSTDVQSGGIDYGDTVLHLALENGQFQVLDWFTPFNRNCIDRADLEIGSGGVALLPAEVGGSRSLAVVLTKEGRLYLLDRANLGHFNATADQVVQQFMVGAHTCDASTTGSAADGTTWNRLYGNASYWNGNLYVAASNAPVEQFSIANGTINPVPVASGATSTGVRGGNTVVSANGNSNGIVWEYDKTANGDAILHAYKAANISTELWNSQMNAARDALNTGGEGFQVPVVIDGKVIATSGYYVDVYTLLP